jgi:outer membrane assembly lipoprotein YfiO
MKLHQFFNFFFCSLILGSFKLAAQQEQTLTLANQESPSLTQRKFYKKTSESQKQQRIPKKFNRFTKKPYQKKFKPKKVPKPIIVTIKKDTYKENLLKMPIRDLNIEQLLDAKNYALASQDKELAIKFLEQVITKSNDQEILRTTRLELADLYFDKGDIKHSGKLYRKYVEFYPGSKNRDYAEYKSVLCRFYVRLKPPLDQSKTRKTISLATLYLDRTDKKTYEDDVIKIRQTCYKDLYEYEMNIFNQYINLEKFTAAQTRLESIKQEFLPIMPEIEPMLLEQEGVVAQKQGKETIVVQKKDELSRRFPNYNPTVLIAATQPKKRFIDLF